MWRIFALFCYFTIFGIYYFAKPVNNSRFSFSEASTNLPAISATDEERQRWEDEAYRSAAAETESPPCESSKAANLEAVQDRHEASTPCPKSSDNNLRPSKGKQICHANDKKNTAHPIPQTSTSPTTDLAQVFEALFEASKYVLGWGCHDCQQRGQPIILRWAMGEVEWWANYTGYGGIWLRELNKMVGMRADDDEVIAVDGSDEAGERLAQRSSSTVVVPQMQLGEWLLKVLDGCMQGAKLAWDCKRCQGRANKMLHRLGWKAVSWAMGGKESRGGWLDVLLKLVLGG